MRILRVLSVLFLSLLLFVPSDKAQTPVTAAVSGAQQSTQPIPQYVRYLFFFHHIAILDQAASRDEVQGASSSSWRTYEQRAIGLTDNESALLKQEATDCNAEVAENEKVLKSAILAIRAQYPRPQMIPDDQQSQVHQIEAERQQIVNSHIARLKSMLGDATFAKVDNYLENRYAHSIQQIAVPRVRTTVPGNATPTAAPGVGK